MKLLKGMHLSLRNITSKIELIFKKFNLVNLFDLQDLMIL